MSQDNNDPSIVSDGEHHCSHCCDHNDDGWLSKEFTVERFEASYSDYHRCIGRYLTYWTLFYRYSHELARDNHTVRSLLTSHYGRWVGGSVATGDSR